MGKSKPTQPAKVVKSNKGAEVKTISSVKEGAITKPSQTPKSKSKEVAKQVAVKAAKGDKKFKKAKKEPTPEPSSSEAENDEEMASASSASSSDESDSEVEVPKKIIKANGAKIDEPESSSSSASSDAEDEESGEDEEEESKPAAPKAASAASKLAPPAKVGRSKAESDSDAESGRSEEVSEEGSGDDEGDESEDDSEDDNVDDHKVEEKPKVKGPVDPKALNGVLAKVASEQVSSAEGSDSEASSESSSSSEDEASGDEASESESAEDETEKLEIPSAKRKADSEALPVPKKSKTEASGSDASKKNLFVGQLSWNVDEEWLTREFEKFGELSSVRIITDKNSGRSKGFGYVEFIDSASAIKAQKEMHDSIIDNRTINVDFSTPRGEAGAGSAKDRAKAFQDQTSPPSDTLFVANIAFGATEDVIRDAFTKHGNVLGVRLPTNPGDGYPKGFGYVQFSSIDEATKALGAMQGFSIEGRSVRLDFSTPRTHSGDRGGRGGRGGGRGFDRGGRGGGRGRGGDRGGRGGGRGGSTNRGGFNDFQGKKMTF